MLLDLAPDAPPPAAEPWTPRRPPGTGELVVQALEEYLRRPSAVLEPARQAVTDVRANTLRWAGVGRELLVATRSAVFPAPHTPLNAATGRQRRVAVARADLDDVKKIRTVHGRTVNDVLLTVCRTPMPRPAVGSRPSWSICRSARPPRAFAWPGWATPCGALPRRDARSAPIV